MRFIKTGLILLFFLLLVGCFWNSNDYDKETIEKAKESAEKYLREEYKNIKTVEIEDVYQGQMGGIRVKGTVNNQYEFGLGVEESDFSVGSIGKGEGFPPRKDDYDKETMKKAEETAKDYIKNNYQDIETIEIRRISRRNSAEDMKINGDVNTYAFVVHMNETNFNVKDIEINLSREGINAPYNKPERRDECKEEECDY